MSLPENLMEYSNALFLVEVHEYPTEGEGRPDPKEGGLTAQRHRGRGMPDLREAQRDTRPHREKGGLAQWLHHALTAQCVPYLIVRCARLPLKKVSQVSSLHQDLLWGLAY